MGTTTKLFSGFDWSLSRFHDTKTALRAERTFNEKVKSEGLTSTWNVGIAEVSGKLGEQHLKAELDQWREESVLRAIEDDAFYIKGPIQSSKSMFGQRSKKNILVHHSRCESASKRSRNEKQRSMWTTWHTINLDRISDRGCRWLPLEM